MNHLSLIVRRHVRSRTLDTLFIALLGVVAVIAIAAVNTAACVALLHG